MQSTTRSDAAFTGSVPQIYATYLVPLLFQEYANDLARRVLARSVDRVLEVAAGTGVVTRAMDATLPAGVEIVATDLQQPMLDQAAAVETKRAVTWRQADAQQLPFEDQTFDAVVCQFGVMFFPDKVKAYSEARRVLRPGGTYVFNVWDRIETNDIADIVQRTVDGLFPSNPPRFLARTPYGTSTRCHPPRSLERRLHGRAYVRHGALNQPRAVRSRRRGRLLPRHTHSCGTRRPRTDGVERCDDGRDRGAREAVREERH